MSVLFSINGQVHGHYTSEFITRTLRMQLLRDYLLVHVDCTNMMLEFRNELFMASRDRLKDAEEARQLRKLLGQVLRKGRLAEIHKHRRRSIVVESSGTEDLIRDMARNMPFNEELTQLLKQTFRLDDRPGRTQTPPPQEMRKRRSTPSGADQTRRFQGQRFPAVFRLKGGDGVGEDGKPLFSVPLRGDRTLQFETDVEDQYFDRTEDPGDMTLVVLRPGENDRTGGTAPGHPRAPDETLNVRRSSPNKGTIRLTLSPNKSAEVGDLMQVRADLQAPGGPIEQIFWVRIVEPQKEGGKNGEGDAIQEAPSALGLPQLILVSESGEGEEQTSWSDLEDQGITMDFDTVMHPDVDETRLSRIFVNLDSRVLRNYRSKQKTQESMEAAEKRYTSTVYFHTLFLWLITQKRQYELRQQEEEGPARDVDVGDYLKDLFSSHYAEFLLNFEMETLIASLGG